MMGRASWMLLQTQLAHWIIPTWPGRWNNKKKATPTLKKHVIYVCFRANLSYGI